MLRWIFTLITKLPPLGNAKIDGDLEVEFVDATSESHAVEAYCLRLAELAVARRHENERGLLFRQELDLLLPAPKCEKPSNVLGVFGLQARLYRHPDSRRQLV